MSVVAMPPYTSTIPASAFSPNANDDNVWPRRFRCVAMRQGLGIAESIESASK